jgi:two-component system OmpR family sensor kinase
MASMHELSQIDAGQLRLQIEDGSLHDLFSDTLRSPSAQAERSAEVEVTGRDTGEGIAPEELERVFERFYRGERERSRSAGAGLGLTIARGIVAAHGGRVWSDSRVGAGTNFHFTLPRSSEAVSRA